MNKLIIIFVITIMNFNSYSQDSIVDRKENDSTLVWSKLRKLTWEDFKSTKRSLNGINTYHATTSAGLFLSYTVEEDIIEEDVIEEDIIKFKILSKFEKYNSYVLLKTEYLLKHEQLHFDIVEVHARKLRKEYLLLKKEKAELDDYLLLFQKSLKDLSKYQNLYDAETLHSKNKINQQKWNEKVKTELKMLEAYRNKECPARS